MSTERISMVEFVYMAGVWTAKRRWSVCFAIYMRMDDYASHKFYKSRLWY
jgi:hypothetical protein